MMYERGPKPKNVRGSQRGLVGFSGNLRTIMRCGQAKKRVWTTLWLSSLLALGACLRWNAPPTASFTRTPDAGDAPLSIFLDASESIDVDGTIEGYTWDFGDGGTAAGMTATHTYTIPGTYEAVLVVTDNEGAEGSTRRAVAVSDPISEPIIGPDVGQSAPSFALRSLGGPEVALEAYRGRVVLLDFWRSTCPPCRSTMPYLESLRETYESDGLVVVTINLDASEEAAREYLEASGLTDLVVLWGSLSDATAVRTLYEVERIPHTFLIDRQGIIRYADHPIRLRDWHIEPWL